MPTRFGRAPGVLHIVGIGPGEAASRTAAAVAALDASTDWVGYGLYLDLVADLRVGQAEHRFPLGDEEARVRHALELAGAGQGGRRWSAPATRRSTPWRRWSTNCSTPTAPRAVTDAARRVAVETHPGISAFQAASAAAGALIGHDFCCISLSATC